MSVLATLRKGFSFVLMSFGISSPAKKAAPKAGTPPQKREGKSA